MSTSALPRVIIVGAGLAGISTGIQLKKQLGFENFTIYEKASAVGGTWRDNTYPGCGSDVPGHWYSLSTDLNPNWTSYFVDQTEILTYWEDLFCKYNLAARTHFGSKVISATWDNEAQLYHVIVEEVATGRKIQTEAEILFYAIGSFQTPLFPKDIQGVETFRGVTWHSAHWRHDVDLKGKRIGVIGNGCSAAQFVPEISKDPLVEVVNFCRTPQWYSPRGNYQYSTWMRWIFKHVPLVMRWYRNFIMVRSDLSFLIFRKDNHFLLKLARRALTRYIEQTAPKDLVRGLTPTYTPGCKRLIADPGYLEALHRPNVSVSWETIESIVEDGIKLKSGEVVPLDVIIFGTGYAVTATSYDIQGSKKSTVSEYFASHGGGTAYLGTCIPGFPNCFTLLGPNLATGHASVIFTEESQIGLAIQLIKPILEGKAKSFEVKEEATDGYNAWLQDRLSRSVWTDCSSFYHMEGQKQGKLVATFPGPVGLFWWLSLHPRWNDFIGVSAEAWKVERRWAFRSRASLVVLAAATALGLWLKGDGLVLLKQFGLNL